MRRSFDRKYFAGKWGTYLFLGALCFLVAVAGIWTRGDLLVIAVFAGVSAYFLFRARLFYLTWLRGAFYEYCPGKSTFILEYHGQRRVIKIDEIQEIVMNGHSEGHSETSPPGAKLKLRSGKTIELPSYFVDEEPMEHYRNLLEIMRKNKDL